MNIYNTLKTFCYCLELIYDSAVYIEPDDITDNGSLEIVHRSIVVRLRLTHIINQLDECQTDDDFDQVYRGVANQIHKELVDATLPINPILEGEWNE